MIFDAVEYAQQELVPILRAILLLLVDESDQSDQLAFFQGILTGLERASDSDDLADPLMALSLSAFSGFNMSLGVTSLLDQLLDKAHRLTASLVAEPDELH